jgi:hypothetical protein
MVSYLTEWYVVSAKITDHIAGLPGEGLTAVSGESLNIGFYDSLKG